MSIIRVDNLTNLAGTGSPLFNGEEAGGSLEGYYQSSGVSMGSVTAYGAASSSGYTRTFETPSTAIAVVCNSSGTYNSGGDGENEQTVTARLDALVSGVTYSFGSSSRTSQTGNNVAYSIQGSIVVIPTPNATTTITFRITKTTGSGSTVPSSSVSNILIFPIDTLTWPTS